MSIPGRNQRNERGLTLLYNAHVAVTASMHVNSLLSLPPNKGKGLSLRDACL